MGGSTDEDAAGTTRYRPRSDRCPACPKRLLSAEGVCLELERRRGDHVHQPACESIRDVHQDSSISIATGQVITAADNDRARRTVRRQLKRLGDDSIEVANVG